MRYCDRLVLLDNGQKVSEGLAKGVLSADNLQTVYGVDAIYGEHEGSEWILPWGQ